jgi:hypothetical protein
VRIASAAAVGAVVLVASMVMMVLSFGLSLMHGRTALAPYLVT